MQEVIVTGLQVSVCAGVGTSLLNSIVEIIRQKNYERKYHGKYIRTNIISGCICMGAGLGLWFKFLAFEGIMRARENSFTGQIMRIINNDLTFIESRINKMGNLIFFANIFAVIGFVNVGFLSFITTTIVTDTVIDITEFLFRIRNLKKT